MPQQPRMPKMPARTRRLVAIVIAVIVVLVLLSTFMGLYTDLLWFRSVGFSKVFTTRLRTQLLLFFVFGLLVALLVAVNAVVAYRLRPPFRPMSQEQQSLDRYRSLLEPIRTWVLVAATLLLFVLAGSAASGQWRTWLQWRNRTEFGVKDAQFHRDVSYFAFTYPFQRFLLGTFFTIVVLSLLVAVAVHYLYGGLRLQSPGNRVSPSARAHLSVLFGAFVLLKAVAYWLDRYGLAFSPRGVVTGPSYTDVNAVLPAKTILAVIAVICALLFFANVALRNWTVPAVAFGLMVLSAVVIGGVYPALVQQFTVKPSEADKEARYIQRNIDATRQAYGITSATTQITADYPGTSTESGKVLRERATTDAQLRLLDPNLLAPTFEQLQQQRAFYGFADTLDIDRYQTGRTLVDTVDAPRELDMTGLTAGQDNWINRHIVYTHGFGFVAAPAGQVDPEGKPVFTEKDIPPTGTLGNYEPRIYFGEKSPSYSIVGATPGSPPRELDRPANTGTGQVNTTYTGKGGVPIGSTFRQLLYAWQFREKNILLSSAVGSQSRILYIRSPRDRVQKVAPWLKLDGDPYSAIVNGRIVWILDGYTTTDGYPYSQRTQLGTTTTDTVTRRSTAVTSQESNEANYIRNSVKATVDAYDGTVTLYEWDEPTGRRDPVLATWMKAFPGTVQPESAMPAALRAHLRYPEDLFKVQRALLTKYHVSDPRAFYNGTDFWRVPDDPTVTGSAPQPPYYLSVAVADAKAPVFSLTSGLVANNRPNLTAFVAVSSQPGVDYGKIRVLQLPRNVTVDGPGQVQNTFESDPTVSSTLTLLRGGGSEVELGNLLTVPLGGGLLYVEPVYVKAAGGQAYPTLRRVLVHFQGTIGFAPTLDQALDQVFGGGTPTGPTPTPSPGGTGNAALRQALTDAQKALADAQAALKAGDFAAYGEAQKRLADAINRAAAASGSGSVSPSPSASPSPTSSPSASP